MRPIGMSLMKDHVRPLTLTSSNSTTHLDIIVFYHSPWHDYHPPGHESCTTTTHLDSLFEMGFAEAIHEILQKSATDRQTLLFSATLPKSLVDFAQAGLTEPVLVRLDVDSKISPDLELAFFTVKPTDKDAALLFLLQNVIKPDQQSIIFASTKHHVEYLHELLLAANIPNSHIYGALDQEARRGNLQLFRDNKVSVLVVTDVAARGIDVPLLNNVINYDFPDRSKLFIHRTGRAARAGRMGTAYSLVTPDDIPYLLDLQLFLGRPFLLAGEDQTKANQSDLKQEIVFGDLPWSLLQDDIERVQELWKTHSNLLALHQVADKGFKLYFRTRHAASKESHHRSRDVLDEAPIGSKPLGVHPCFIRFLNNAELERADIMDQIRNFRPAETIFEFRKMGVQKSTVADDIMKARRKQATFAIEKRKETKLLKRETKAAKKESQHHAGESTVNGVAATAAIEVDEEEIAVGAL